MFDRPLTVSIGAAALFLLTALVLRRLRAGRAAAEAERRRAEAAALGLRYQLSTGEPLPGQGPGSAPPAGAHVYSGASAGQAWQASVEVSSGSGRRRSRSPRTRIHFSGPAAAPGRFLVMVPIPPGVKVPGDALPSGDGLLVRLAEKAAESFLDLYVAAYFGAEHRALVNVAGAARPAGPDGLFVLCSDEGLAGRLLDAEGRALLEALRRQEGGPGEQKALQGFGLLVTQAGLVYGCPVALWDPAVLRALAERVARLVLHARGGGSTTFG